MKALAASLAILLVAACASQPAAPPQFACNAAAAQAAVGKLATGGLMEDARIAANARIVRTLSPGQAVTLEYNDQRLNLEVDAANVVRRVSCG